MLQLRLLVCRLTIWGLVGLGVLLIVSQWTELKTHTESVPLVSTVTFLALSGVAFNWARLDEALVMPHEKRIAKQAGVDLFMASMLALVTQGLLWAAPLFIKAAPLLSHGLVLAHTMLLGVAILMAWLPIRRPLLLAGGR